MAHPQLDRHEVEGVRRARLAVEHEGDTGRRGREAVFTAGAERPFDEGACLRRAAGAMPKQANVTPNGERPADHELPHADRRESSAGEPFILYGADGCTKMGTPHLGMRDGCHEEAGDCEPRPVSHVSSFLCAGRIGVQLPHQRSLINSHCELLVQTPHAKPLDEQGDDVVSKERVPVGTEQNRSEMAPRR